MTTPRQPLNEQHVTHALRDFERLGAKPPRPKSVFERIKLGTNNFIDTTGDTRVKLKSTAKKTTKPVRKDRHIAAAQLEEPQYSMEVQFSSEPDYVVKANGEVSYTEPLVNPGYTVDDLGNTHVKPVKDRTYQVRIRLTQHHAGQLFQGVKLDWRLPAGWVFTDGHGRFTYHEFVSNPLVIVRLARYESGTKGWRVIIAEWYR